MNINDNLAVSLAEGTAVPAAQPTAPLLATRRLNAYFGNLRAVRNVTVAFPDREVSAVIGPSGCGKSTFLRCLNRMHETVPTAGVEGDALLGGVSIYKGNLSAIEVRRQVGMVFQRPTPFPTMSIRDNVAAGLRILGRDGPSRKEVDEIVEDSLGRAGLLTEVKDRLRESAVALSGGQQQRLCIARALATRPRVLLLDEPTASLDPVSTQTIEELLYELRKTICVVIVTHNMGQARRVSDMTACLMLDDDRAKDGQRTGVIAEFTETDRLFTNPKDPRTEAYITGRIG